ncbi:uncharacterized protein LOC135605246 isoform X2 [Musa acuminata AAA Group]
MNGATDGNGGFANDAGGLEAAVATPDTTGTDGGGGQRLVIDAAAGGGDGGEDAADAIAVAAGPELLRKLVFEGMTVTSFSIGAAVRPPAHLASHQLPPVAYYANDAGGLEAAVATLDTTGADGGGGQRLFIDAAAAAGGGDGGEDAADAIAGAAGPELLRKLVFEGMTVTSFCIGAAVRPPAHLASHQLLPVAYYLALLVLFLFGVGLLGLAVWVSGDRVGRAAVAKTVMWIAVAPLLLVLSLGGIGMT